MYEIEDDIHLRIITKQSGVISNLRNKYITRVSEGILPKYMASKPFGSSKKEPIVDTNSAIGSLFFSRKALYIQGFFFFE